MIPIVTPEQMAAMDLAAPEPVEVLIGRVGGAVARAALDVLGGTYGRRVVVLAGKGNNGNDGREAARRLRSRGVRVAEIDALSMPESLPAADLVIDAAFGTGFRGEYRAPLVAEDAAVLAVDIPSGVDGLTGLTSERVIPADVTVTFAALKPGLVLEPGAAFAGHVLVADIGLDASSADTHLVEQADVAAWVPTRPALTHKWRSALCVVGGSPGMEGAAALVGCAALRTGAGYVRWSAPGATPGPHKPLELVGVGLSPRGWAAEVLADAGRFAAMTMGNGLGLDPDHATEVARLVSEAPVPVVVDADAITLLGENAASVAGPTTVFTPHDGEFARLAGHPPGPDRVRATRELAASLGAVVLLKGSTTIVADPRGEVLVSTSGDSRLATLGTGDVLTGVVGALCAMGLDPFRAAAAAAFLHGRAAALGWRNGLVAGDLLALLPEALAVITGGAADRVEG